MMQRLGFPFLELEMAVPLAAYIVYQVKRTVDYVGLDTDIIEIRNGVPLLFSREEIDEMEAQFRDYDSVERDNLYYYFGGDISQREQLTNTVGSHGRREKSIRKFFKRWSDKRRTQFPVGIQRVAPKPPVTSQSQEPEQ